MFQNSEEAKNLYALASEKKIFIMEALWSRYLPAVQQVKRWVEQEKIGKPTVLQCNIGFLAPDEKKIGILIQSWEVARQRILLSMHMKLRRLF